MSAEKAAVDVTTTKDVQKPEIRFEDMGLSNVLLQRIVKDIGLTKPTKVQAACIIPIIKGRNCVAMSPTGSGKTMAYAIPMLHCWAKDPYGIYGVILTPTRELAQQVKEQFDILGGNKLRTTIIMGGVDMQTETLELYQRPHFIIATPGRLADHMDTGGDCVLNLFRNVKFVVYDEYDRLFEEQFDEQRETITRCLPATKQTLMFSATMRKELESIGENTGPNGPLIYNYMSDNPSKSMLIQNLVHKYILCPPDFKDGYLMEVLRLVHENKFEVKVRSMIIFVATCRECQVISLLLTEMGFPNVTLHSRVDQKTRLNSLVKFRSSVVQILVATDVVSRGLDIKEVDLVLNYSVPMPTDYVHRVGRTGRGGRPGFSLVLINPRDVPFLFNVEGYIKQELTEFEMDELKVLLILTDVSATKKIADLRVEESDPFEERKRINERKKRILKGLDPSDDDDDESEEGEELDVKIETEPSKPKTGAKRQKIQKKVKKSVVATKSGRKLRSSKDI